jgi:hypothetical protein
MRHPLGELRRLLIPQAATTGVVVAIIGGVAKVATRNGLANGRVVGQVALGDRVKLDAGTVTRAPQASRSYPV